MINLKEVLMNSEIKNGIKKNMFFTATELEEGIEKTRSCNKNNSLSIEINRNGDILEFENTLYSDEGNKNYLLESRLFKKQGGEMIGAYLEILNSKKELSEEYVDDVWTYSDWKVV